MNPYCPLGNYCPVNQGSADCYNGNYQNCPTYNKDKQEEADAIIDGESLLELRLEEEL